MNRLDGKRAVVTGAAQGIGRAIALKLSDLGAQVTIGDVAPDVAKETVDLSEGAIRSIEADVSVPEDCERLISEAADPGGRLDILANNAGIEIEATIVDTSVEDWDRLMNINLRGVFLCTKYAIPLMMASGGGAIINTASVNGYWAEAELGAYCASKGGVIGLTKSTAIDFGKYGIRCNAICPGHIDTALTQRYYDTTPDPAEARAKAEQLHPVGRLGQPQDVAEMAAWLATDEASFASGQCFVIDGALTAGRTVSLD